MTRKYSSTSVETTLAAGLSNNATTMTVATGTASSLLGGVTLAVGNVDQFTIALDANTANEEIIFVTAVSSDTLTIVRGRAGSSAITHTGGASVKHVLTSDDLNSYANLSDAQTFTNKTIDTATNTITGAVTLSGSQTITGAKTFSTAPVISAITNTGTLTLPTSTDVIVGRATADTLTNKTLTAPIVSYSINAQTGTSYTAVAADAGAIVTINNAAANTFNIPTNASVPFAIGTCLTVIAINAAAGTTGTQTTIQAVTSGTTTIAAAAATPTAPKLRTQYSSASIIKIGTDLWYVVGDLLQ